MKITGQILKENRERKGISVNDVAIATKINTRLIIAMESGDLEHLPPKTFLRGFVRAYATFLNLNAEEILNTFYEEMGSTKPKTEINQTSLAKQSDDAAQLTNHRPALFLKFGAILGILLLVVLILVIKKKMESYESESAAATVSTTTTLLQGSPSPTPTASPTPSDASAPDSSVATVATAASTPAATATPSQTPTPSPTPKATPVAIVAAPTATPKPTPSPTPKPTPAPTTTTTTLASSTPKPSPSPSINGGRSQEVLLEALDNTDVDAQVDGEPSKKIHLDANQIHEFKAKHKVVLKLSDGGAVNITVNGKDRGVPGDLGKPKKVEFP
jgi:cytoskeleton protein RodZ